MGTAYNTNVVTDDLIGCWDAGNRRSYPTTGTVLTDLAGGVNGTLTNLILTPLRVDISSLMEQMGALTVVII